MPLLVNLDDFNIVAVDLYFDPLEDAARLDAGLEAIRRFSAQREAHHATLLRE